MRTINLFLFMLFSLLSSVPKLIRKHQYFYQHIQLIELRLILFPMKEFNIQQLTLQRYLLPRIQLKS